MKTPFRTALELAWSDGSMSKQGALMLEELGDALGLSIENRAELEQAFITEALDERSDRGTGAGSELLRPWLDRTVTELGSDELSLHLNIIACSAVDAGLSKRRWQDGLRYATELGLQDVFARAVWAENQREEVTGDVPLILQPLSEHLLG